MKESHQRFSILKCKNDGVWIIIIVMYGLSRRLQCRDGTDTGWLSIALEWRLRLSVTKFSSRKLRRSHGKMVKNLKLYGKLYITLVKLWEQNKTSSMDRRSHSSQIEYLLITRPSLACTGTCLTVNGRWSYKQPLKLRLSRITRIQTVYGGRWLSPALLCAVVHPDSVVRR